MEKGKVIKQSYKLCCKCGNFINSELEEKYCYLCGTKYIDRCPQCKEEIIYPLAKVCPACGYKLIKTEKN